MPPMTPTAKQSYEALRRELFDFDEEAGESLYAVLDGASVPGLTVALLRYAPENVCLYSGELDVQLARVAPYLIRVEPDSGCAEWLLREGWGAHWGIFAVAGVGLREMRKHFRKFLRVRGPDDRPLYFRYYDPRVFRVYLPTCNPAETEFLFGPVTRYTVEGENPESVMHFRRLKVGKSGPVTEIRSTAAQAPAVPIGVGS
jgi:hypothetical protein